MPAELVNKGVLRPTSYFKTRPTSAFFISPGLYNLLATSDNDLIFLIRHIRMVIQQGDKIVFDLFLFAEVL